MAEEKKMGRPKGSRDRKPRRTEGYQESSPKNLVKARENSPITQAQKAEMPEGYNAKVTAFMMSGITYQIKMGGFLLSILMVDGYMKRQFHRLENGGISIKDTLVQPMDSR